MALTQVQSGLLESGAALTNIGAGTITPSYLSTQSQYTGFKNRIINGAMVIDQRNAGAAVVNAGFSVDRWFTFYNTGTVSTQQSAIAPAGFTNSLAFTVTTGASPNQFAQNYITQRIEGFNVADFAWGTASAQAVTLSFWVRSSVTGTFSGSVMNSGYSRSFVFTYTVNTANTYEYKTVLISGDTSGTWATNNSIGIRLNFDTGSGTFYNGTAGTWSAGEFNRAAGAVTLVGTSGATFFITGVQLEKGSTATSFDYRPYGTELALCQRYYDLLTGGIGGGNQTSTTNCGFSLSFRVPKRTAPTPSLVGTVNANDGNAQVNISSITNYFYGDINGILINFTTASLTANRPTLIYSTGSSAGLALSAEL